ncbi:MAG TPA: RidA family protein [Longimicrobiales bacterium]|nr:RidA family protein [Longimicrobiales bacterium]
MRNQTTVGIIALLVLLPACASRGPDNRQIIAPGNAQTLATYSPAVRAGDLIFFSGQIGLRPGGQGLAGNIRDETRQSLDNLRALMNAANVGIRNLVKCTVFLADIRDYEAMNEVYAGFFEPDPAPARSAVGVAGLPAGARVEIECIASVAGSNGE